MSAPLSSVNGPDAANRPFAFRSARYCRCVGRTSAIFALSWLYSMMAAYFITDFSRLRGLHGRLDRGCGLAAENAFEQEQAVGEDQVAEHEAVEGVARIADHQLMQVRQAFALEERQR